MRAEPDHRKKLAPVIAEIDTQPGFEITFSSSESGKTFSYPFSTVFHFEYPNGTTPGALVILRATGLEDKVPGIPADAGLVTYGDANVLFVDPNGVPIVDFGAPTAIAGHANDFSSVIAAGCAALAQSMAFMCAGGRGETLRHRAARDSRNAAIS